MQAARQDTTVFAVVRKASASTHLAKAIAGLKNVLVVEGDIVDYSSIEVRTKFLLIHGPNLDSMIYSSPSALPRKSLQSLEVLSTSSSTTPRAPTLRRRSSASTTCASSESCS